MHGALMFPNWQPAPEPEVWECYGVPFRSVADINGDMLFVLGIGSIVYAPAANPLDFVPIPGTAIKVRTDVSTTVFFSEPEEYEGGELVVVDTYGTHEVKLPAGDLILYPSTSLHRVEPVTRGERVCSFFWASFTFRPAAITTWICRRASSPT